MFYIIQGCSGYLYRHTIKVTQQKSESDNNMVPMRRSSVFRHPFSGFMMVFYVFVVKGYSYFYQLVRAVFFFYVFAVLRMHAYKMLLVLLLTAARFINVAITLKTNT